MFLIARDGQERLRRRLEQQAVDRRFVLIRDVSDLGWQREDYVEVLDWQQVFHACLHPVLRRSALALRAVPVPARVVGDVLMIAFGASRDVTAKGSSPAVLNRRHHFELRQVQVRGMVTAIGRPAGAEDIRDLQFGTGHRGWA